MTLLEVLFVAMSGYLAFYAAGAGTRAVQSIAEGAIAAAIFQFVVATRFSRSATLVAKPQPRSKYQGQQARRTQRTRRRATAERKHLGARKAHPGIFSRMALVRL